MSCSAEQRAQAKRDLLAAGLKRCSACEQTYDLSHFNKDKRRTDGLFPYCRACRMARDGRSPRPARKFATKAEYDKDYRARRDAASDATERHQRRYLWNSYRMTPEQYDEMLEQQGGTCAICGLTPWTTSKYGTPGRLAVDHDHSCCEGSNSCGRCIRGLLCHACNMGIGTLRDDPARLRSAITYLEDHERKTAGQTP